MLRKFGVATHIYIPIVKAGSANFAVGADWTPAAGDVKISKDGGAAANVTNLPTAITMGNAAMWDFSLTATEMQAASVVIIVADSATKAVEDQAIVIETYGNASGEHAFDLDTATQSVTVAAGGLTAASVATDAIDADALADGAITAATFAAGAIDAAAIAADAIGSSELAASAVTEIQSGLASQASVDTIDDFLDTEIAAIKAKTDNLPASPAATGDIPSAASIADAVWDESTTGHTTSGTFGEQVKTDVDAILADTGTDGVVVASINNGAITAAAIATGAVDADALATDAVTEIAAGITIPTAASVADAVWDEARADHTTAGTFGQGVASVQGSVTGNVDGNVSGSVASVATGGITAGSIAADAIGASELAADAVTEIQSGLATAASITTLTGYVDTEVAAIKAKTDNLPASPAATGDIPTAATIADAVWDEATTGHTTSGTFGEQAKTDIDAILAAVDTEVASIVSSLATISGYLDTEVAAILAAVDTEVAAIKAKTDNLPAAPAATGDIPTAAQVRDAILAGTVDELSAVPAASPTVEQALAFLFMALRNKVTTSTTETKIHNDAGTAIATATVGDTGSTFTRGEYA